MDGFSLLGNSYCYPVCGWQAMLINGNCMGCSQFIDSCYSCAMQGLEAVCSECLPGYLLSNNECVSCGSMISGCFMCNTPLTCLLCQAGYILTHEGYRCSALLESCPANCLYCVNASTCLQCQWGYSLSGTSCVASSLKNCPSNLILNGSSCVCASGSYLKGASCASCVDNCLSCSTYACSVCTTGFYLNEGVCSRCSENCLDCGSSSWCKICKLGYAGIEGKCVYVGADSALANTGDGLLSCPAGCEKCAADKNGQLTCLQTQAGSTFDK